MQTPIPFRQLAAALAFAVMAGPAAAQYSTPMRDVENPDRSVFAQTIGANLTPPYVNGFLYFNTPTGFRYFVDQLSLVCTTPSASDQITLVQLSTQQKVNASLMQGNTLVPFVMTRVGPAPFGGWTWAGSTQIRAFSDASAFDSGGGRTMLLNIFHTEPSVTVSCTGSVVGHTLPMAP